jgi:hypothetical protein
MTQQDGWYLASDGRWYPNPPGGAPASPYAAGPGYGPAGNPYAAAPGYGPSGNPYAAPGAGSGSNAWIAWVVAGVVVVLGLAVVSVYLFVAGVNDRRQAFVEGRGVPYDATFDPSYPDLVEPPSADPAAWHGRLADAATLTRDSRTVDVVRLSDLKTAATYAGRPRPQRGRYVVVTVTFAATEPLDVNPFDFEVVMKDGRRFRFNSGNADASALDAPLGLATAQIGEPLTGQLMFDVPPGHGEVVWTPFQGTSFAWAY